MLMIAGSSDDDPSLWIDRQQFARADPDADDARSLGPDRQQLTQPRAEMRAADTKWLRIAFWVRSPATYSPDAVDPWAAGSDGSQLRRDSWSQIANG